jgi:hypothetical protein
MSSASWYLFPMQAVIRLRNLGRSGEPAVPEVPVRQEGVQFSRGWSVAPEMGQAME